MNEKKTPANAATTGKSGNRTSAGSFTDKTPLAYTPQDFRFTYKNAAIYVFAMNYDNNTMAIKSLRRDQRGAGDFDIKSVSVLGHDAPVEFKRDEHALYVDAGGKIGAEYPVCIRVGID